MTINKEVNGVLPLRQLLLRNKAFASKIEDFGELLGATHGRGSDVTARKMLNPILYHARQSMPSLADFYLKIIVVLDTMNLSTLGDAVRHQFCSQPATKVDFAVDTTEVDLLNDSVPSEICLSPDDVYPETCKRTELTDGDIGVTYESVFGESLTEFAINIELEDPYLALPHQVTNLKHLFDLLWAKCPNLADIKIVTNLFDRDEMQKLETECEKRGIQFTLEVNTKLHDRKIAVHNHTVENIYLGRGLDLWKQKSTTVSNQQVTQTCRETTVIAVKCRPTKNYKLVDRNSVLTNSNTKLPIPTSVPKKNQAGKKIPTPVVPQAANKIAPPATNKTSPPANKNLGSFHVSNDTAQLKKKPKKKNKKVTGTTTPLPSKLLKVEASGGTMPSAE